MIEYKLPIVTVQEDGSLMGKGGTEYFQLNNYRTYSVSKDASYTSIYNRKFFEGKQPLSEECKKELQLLKV